MQKMYPYSEVFYKTDDTPGWNVAILLDDEECVKQKAEKLWKTYKIFSGGETAWKQEDVLNAVLEPEMTHLTSNWIYSSELGKWFFPDEEIPVPKSKCETSKTLKINFDLSEYEDENEVSELAELYLENLDYENRDEVQITFYIAFQTDKNHFKWSLLYSDKVCKQIQNFIDDLKNKTYAYVIFEEYEYIKLLVWNCGEKVRAKIQDYNSHDEVKEPLDFEVSKDVFVSELEKFLKNITSVYEPLNAAARKEAEKIKLVSP